MHLRDDTSELLDEEGAVHDSLDDLRAAVLKSARDLICHDTLDGTLDLRFRLDAEDEDGTLVYSMPFTGALSVIYPPEG